MRTRESERTRARNRKRKSKRKERSVVINYIIRASALYVRATKGAVIGCGGNG